MTIGIIDWIIIIGLIMWGIGLIIENKIKKL